MVRERLVLDAATRTAAGGAPMSWPEAFSNVGIAMAVALIVFAICRWG
ncbi:hypothetical protein SB392_005179 [Escherichia coli]|nr:hypothetical protein [Escherichia coli]